MSRLPDGHLQQVRTSKAEKAENSSDFCKLVSTLLHLLWNARLGEVMLKVVQIQVWLSRLACDVQESIYQRGQCGQRWGMFVWKFLTSESETAQKRRRVINHGLPWRSGCRGMFCRLCRLFRSFSVKFGQASLKTLYAAFMYYYSFHTNSTLTVAILLLVLLLLLIAY